MRAPFVAANRKRARQYREGALSLLGLEYFSRRHVGAILEGFDDPAIIVATDRKILATNARYLDAYSSDGSLLGRKCHEVSHGCSVPCDQRGEHCPVLDCRESGDPCRAVHVHVTPRGTRHEEITIYPVSEPGGEILAFLEVIRPLRVFAAERPSQAMVGQSPAFNHALGLARRVASRSTPVLLLGETGTGKELLARAIHEMSDRSQRPFVPVDCAGISETLFESEMFGHEKGAFTGATYRKIGLVESVSGGTLFLDEVGDIPLPQQVKLLRLLENGLFRLVGSTKFVNANFRLICASHRDLQEMVKEGAFRSDLYYRLSVFPIRLPRLRERAEDVALLAQCLLRQVGCSPTKRLDPRTVSNLESYDFKGNVRELRNVLERACMLASGNIILPEHLPAELYDDEKAEVPLPRWRNILPMAEVERRYLAWAMQHFGGDNQELARRLGLSERTLYRKLRRVREEAMQTTQERDARVAEVTGSGRHHGGSVGAPPRSRAMRVSMRTKV